MGSSSSVSESKGWGLSISNCFDQTYYVTELYVGCSAPSPDVVQNIVLSFKTCQKTLEMHSEHGYTMPSGPGNDQFDKIIIPLIFRNYTGFAPKPLQKLSANRAPEGIYLWS